MEDKIYRAIDSYKKSNDKKPLIVDVSSTEDMSYFQQQYLLENKIDIFTRFNKDSEIPSISDLYEFMETCNEDICFIYGLGTLLKLKGLDEFNHTIHSILSKSFKTKFIIVTLLCEKYFNEKTPKLRDNIIISKRTSSLPNSSLVFVPVEYKGILRAENNLGVALSKMEKPGYSKIYVSTNYKKESFCNTLLTIEECNSPFDLLCLKDRACKKLNPNFGDKNQWGFLLDKLIDNSIEKTICAFISANDILNEIKNWNEKTENEKWLIFIYYKLKDISTGNWAVDYSLKVSEKYKDVIDNIYKSILDFSYKENGFWEKYQARKKILKYINEDTVIYQYCSFVQYKKEETLYYLTDNTDNEKKVMIQIIDKYKDSFTKTKLLNILQKIYPDMYYYLCDYNFGNSFLNTYFSDYKYLKLKNTLTDDFKKMVDEEAVNRSFKKILQYRTEKLDEIDFTDAKVYFVDALGAEFLSYIERKCQEKGLSCRSMVCKSYLPSITSKNTEFRDYFARKNVEVIDEKRLDSLIHDGKNDYDFDKNKLPIHIIEEFKIINDCLDNIRKKIKSQTIKKAVIISDHGATRLAILNTDMVKEDVESTGEHGGRVCKVVPGMKTIPNAIIEDDYCILADYNAIKGGRVGKVEMHGGATIEEVTVPIIEIVDKTTVVEIKVLSTIIKVSFKRKAVLYFYSSSKLKNAVVKIAGKIYSCKTDDYQNFEVELPDIQKSGKYDFEVWNGDEIVSSGNEFNVEKEAAKSVDLWG